MIERQESYEAMKGITEKWKFFSYPAPIQSLFESSRDPGISEYGRKNSSLRGATGRSKKMAAILHSLFA